MDSALVSEKSYKRDLPGQFWDYVVVSSIGLACIPFILGNFVLLCNRNYRPIKTKNVNLTVLSSVGGLIWIATTVVVNGHFERKKKSVWAACPLWTFWFQACFGFALWLNCLNVHFLVLYHIFILKKVAGKMKFNLIRLFCLLMPTIVFCTCASIFRSTSFEASKRDCRGRRAWSLGLVALLITYFVIFIVLAFKLRSKALSQFNEFRLIKNGGVMSFFSFLLFLVTVQTHANEELIGRAFLSLSVSAAVFYYFWGRNGEVIYNVILHKEEFLRKFNENLQRRHSERERDNFPSSFWNLESELEEARNYRNRLQADVEKAEEEILCLENRLRHLHREAHSL